MFDPILIPIVLATLAFVLIVIGFAASFRAKASETLLNGALYGSTTCMGASALSLAGCVFTL